MKRRHFLHNLAHVAAALHVFFSCIYNLDFQVILIFKYYLKWKYNCIIKLDGGNDGLNTVIPLDQCLTYQARPHVIFLKIRLFL